MKTTNRLFVFLVAGMLVITGAACQRSEDRPVEAAPEPDEVLTAADQTFLNDVLRIHVEEQALARLAKTKAQNEDVRDYAEMLENDHTDALQDTVDLMEKYNIQQPADLDMTRQTATAKFEGKTGQAFDQEYINMMVQGHQQALDKAQQHSAATQNEDVREFAQDMMGSVEKHLNEAKEIQAEPVRTN
jgi:putative membrane protein